MNDCAYAIAQSAQASLSLGIGLGLVLGLIVSWLFMRVRS